MSYKMFLQETEKNMPRAVYLFYSSEPFLIREALIALRACVSEDARDFNFHVFDYTVPGEEQLSIEKILQVVNTASFFGGRRFTVLLSSVQKFTKKDAERLSVYVENPAQDSVFVLFHEGVLKKIHREKFKAFRPISLDIKEQDIPFWVKKKAKSKGMDLSAETANYLIGFVGTDLGLLASEIDKLSLLGKDRPSKKDISNIIAGGKTFTVFNLVNALRDGDANTVFTIYRSLRETAEDYSLIGALNWQYGRMYQFDNTRSTRGYYLSIFKFLSEVDKDLKSSGRAFPMEYLLIKLLQMQKVRESS